MASSPYNSLNGVNLVVLKAMVLGGTGAYIEWLVNELMLTANKN